MANRTYYARIKLGNATQVVTVQAGSYQNAKAMIEAQYGKGCIVGGPSTSVMR